MVAFLSGSAARQGKPGGWRYPAAAAGGWREDPPRRRRPPACLPLLAVSLKIEARLRKRPKMWANRDKGEIRRRIRWSEPSKMAENDGIPPKNQGYTDKKNKK